MFALVDCNNFYASCERVFDPGLKNRPIVVLSNNDGCIIARSNEAKKIGIPMGAPVFQAKNLIDKYNVKLCSANFSLYGDISSRVMRILAEAFPDIEIYSIDEAFLALDKLKVVSLTEYCSNVRELILRSTGIPVSIGIAPTKTLAKICSHIAKKSSKVSNWNEIEDKDKTLKETSVEEIWGVGYRTSKKLNAFGVYTALDLRDKGDMWVRKQFNVTMLRTVSELKEISCLPLETVFEPRKGIMSSRSFGRPVTKLSELEEAVSTYTSRACEKLIEQGSAAAYIYVSIKTNMHRTDIPQYFQYKIVSLPNTTWYVPDFINAALRGLREIYKPGYRYKKATVMLLGIVPKDQVPLSLFGNQDFKKIDKINNIITTINREHGSEFIKYAATGIRQQWRMKHEMCSPRYTTRWEEILKIKI
jgi:DNA polymerase V